MVFINLIEFLSNSTTEYDTYETIYNIYFVITIGRFLPNKFSSKFVVT